MGGVKNVAHLLARHAGAPAVGDLTWAEVEALAAGLAGRLRRQGVLPGDRVGLQADASGEAVVGLHGILRAGAVCVPLDPSWPRLRRMALAADAGLWALAGTDPLGPLPLVKAVGKPGTAPVVEVPADAPALLVYVSGKRPRAVIRTHENLQAWQPPGGRLGFLAFEDALLATVSGAALVPWEEATVLSATPTVLLGLLGRPRPDVEVVLVHGEPFPPARLAEVRRTFPAARLVEVYGSVETGVVALDGDPVSSAWVRALGGELFVRGPGVTPGYWRRPAATARAFDGDWFRTGDLARLEDLVLLGRRDRRVWIRGQRVEPGEVEAALMRHPDVEQAAVVVVEGALHAFASGRELNGLELRKHLVRRLPTVMMPRTLQILEELPRTRSGKADRRALARRLERD